MKAQFANNVATLPLTGLILSTFQDGKREIRVYRVFLIHITAMMNAVTVCGEYIR